MLIPGRVTAGSQNTSEADVREHDVFLGDEVQSEEWCEKKPDMLLESAHQWHVSDRQDSCHFS